MIRYFVLGKGNWLKCNKELINEVINIFTPICRLRLKNSPVKAEEGKGRDVDIKIIV